MLGLALLAGCASEVSGAAAGVGRDATAGATTVAADSPGGPRSTTQKSSRGITTSGTATTRPASDPSTDGTAEPVDPSTEDAGTPTEPTSTSVAATTVPQVQANLGWLKPGARASYYFGAVSTAAHRYSWTENPSGDYTDPKTGKRYSSDKGIAPASQAAEGVMHFDVLAVGNDGVAFGRTSALLDRSTNVFTPVPNPEAAVAANKVGQVWIAPEALRSMLSSGNDQDQVLVGPITFEGKQVQTVLFVNNSPNNYYFHAYDPTTGLLLQSDTSVASTESTDGTSPPATNTRSHLELKSLRQRGLPGFGAALPEWVGRGLAYASRVQLVDPSSGQPMAGAPTEFTEQITFEHGGDGWAKFALTRGYNDGQSENRTGYLTGAGPYLMDPKALGAMKAGAQLDIDELTGETIAVGQVDAQRVAVSIRSNGNEWLGVYDKQSGVLLQAEQKNATTYYATQLQQS